MNLFLKLQQKHVKKEVEDIQVRLQETTKELPRTEWYPAKAVPGPTKVPLPNLKTRPQTSEGLQKETNQRPPADKGNETKLLTLKNIEESPEGRLHPGVPHGVGPHLREAELSLKRSGDEKILLKAKKAKSTKRSKARPRKRPSESERIPRFQRLIPAAKRNQAKTKTAVRSRGRSERRPRKTKRLQRRPKSQKRARRAKSERYIKSF